MYDERAAAGWTALTMTPFLVIVALTFLTRGPATEAAAPTRTTSIVITEVAPPSARADLDGDGRPDTATLFHSVVLVESTRYGALHLDLGTPPPAGRLRTVPRPGHPGTSLVLLGQEDATGTFLEVQDGRLQRARITFRSTLTRVR